MSFADDRGGNFIRESGPCVNSLHTVWDVCIIEKKLGTDPQAVARDLMESTTDSDKAAWVAIPVAGWANESFQVTRRKSVQYCVRVGTKCVYQQGPQAQLFYAGGIVVRVHATCDALWQQERGA